MVEFARFVGEGQPMLQRRGGTTALGVEIATRDRVLNVRSSPLPPDAWDRMERQAADPGTELDDTPEDAELSDGEFLLQLHADVDEPVLSQPAVMFIQPQRTVLGLRSGSAEIVMGVPSEDANKS
jgi:hypothetical protein